MYSIRSATLSLVVAIIDWHLLNMNQDYVDPAYAKLAAKAQDLFRTDPGLAPYYFEQGFAFITDGKPGLFFDLWKQMHTNIKEKQDPSTYVEMDNPDQVFRGIHGEHSQSVTEARLGRDKQWRLGYTNLKAAVANAEGCVNVYYQRCCEKPQINFACGTPVDRLLYGDDKAVQGVVLEDGRVLRADKTIVSAGAWSNRLVNLEQQMHARGVEVAYIKLTREERAKWKNMPIHTNLSTGFNLFPPIDGQIKILRRSPGLRNTVSVKDPEDPSKSINISLPRTTVDSPNDNLDSSMEASLRQELREIMPTLADRPFTRTRFCWCVWCLSCLVFLCLSHAAKNC